MKQKDKILGAVSFSVLGVTTLSIRQETELLTVFGMAILLMILLIYRNKFALWGFTISAVLLYPGPQIGWLYGRDSLVAARIAREIQTHGWPLQINTTVQGFSKTPFLHFHAIVLKAVTGLAIIPTTHSQLLVTTLLPLIYTSVVFCTTYILIRRYLNGMDNVNKFIVFLPVILWTPLLAFRTGFRRGSLSLLLFGIFVYLLFRIINENDTRFYILLLLVVFSSIATHHVGAFMLLSVWAILAGILLLSRYRPFPIPRSESFPLYGLLVPLAIFLGLLFVWQFILNLGGDFIILFIKSFFITSSNNIPWEASVTFWALFQKVFSLWLYQAILGTLIIIGVGTHLYRGTLQVWDFLTICFGAFVAVICFVLLILHIDLEFGRVMTYFTITGAWIGIVKLYEFWPQISDLNTEIIARVVVCLLIILGASMISPHVLLDENPSYRGAETDQRFSKSLYATATFAKRYVNKPKIVGDANTKEVVESISSTPVNTAYKNVEHYTVPADSTVILSNRNKYLYMGRTGGSWAAIRLIRPFVHYNRSADRVYTNGNEIMYTASSGNYRGSPLRASPANNKSVK